MWWCCLLTPVGRPCPCSFLGVSGREVDAKWDENGAGAAFFLQQEMSDALTGDTRGC